MTKKLDILLKAISYGLTDTYIVSTVAIYKRCLKCHQIYLQFYSTAMYNNLKVILTQLL